MVRLNHSPPGYPTTYTPATTSTARAVLQVKLHRNGLGAEGVLGHVNAREAEDVEAAEVAVRVAREQDRTVGV